MVLRLDGLATDVAVGGKTKGHVVGVLVTVLVHSGSSCRWPALCGRGHNGRVHIRRNHRHVADMRIIAWSQC